MLPRAALALTLSLVLSLPTQAQYARQNLGILATNSLFHGLASGTGALLNAERGSRSGWQTFSRGFAQGAAGGAIMHGGRMLTHQIEARRELAWAWPAHLVHAAGASVAENAAYGRRPLSHFHLTAWGLRFDYDLPDRRFRTRAMSSGIVGFFVVNSPDHEINWGRSLATGFQYFDLRPGTFGAKDGRNFAAAISVGVDEESYADPEGEYYAIAAHEVSHALGFEARIQLNPLAEPLVRRVRGRTWWDVPARLIYFDLNGPIDYALYYAAGFDDPDCYWSNPFERNTEHFSAQRYVGCP